MTVRLRPLTLSANFGDEATAPPGAAGETLNNTDKLPCPFCGMHSGRWQRLVAAPCRGHHDCAAACVLCYLCRHLERPRIDEEAAVVWLPEMSQPALNVTMREIHLQLREFGEELYDVGRLRLDTPERCRLYHARSALSARAQAAASRLGTDKPSELAGALCRLSPGAYANRAKLLDGVRLLPLGRFYAGNKNVYPEIVDSWRGISQPPPGLAPVRPALPSGA
jgi:intracellular multiplication protein IcmJ